jgi:hypothetical protein
MIANGTLLARRPFPVPGRLRLGAPGTGCAGHGGSSGTMELNNKP